MTERHKDALLISSKIFVLILQGVSALAGVVTLLLVPIIVLASQGLLNSLFGSDGIPDVAKDPVLGVVLCLLLTAVPTAMFFFLGKMRAIIETLETVIPSSRSMRSAST